MCFIILEDGRAWSAASWAYDAAIRYIAEAVRERNTPEAIELAAWLLLQTNEEKGTGMGSVDLRELTTANRALFRTAAHDAFARLKLHPPNDWGDPTFFPPWLERFQVLLRLFRSVDRREDPKSFNPHMRGLIDPTGEKAGPGWDS